MKSFCTFKKFWVVLLLSLILCGTATAGEVASRPAAAITAQTTAFLQKFMNEEAKVNHENLQRNPELLDALLSDITDFDVNEGRDGRPVCLPPQCLQCIGNWGDSAKFPACVGVGYAQLFQPHADVHRS